MAGFKDSDEIMVLRTRNSPTLYCSFGFALIRKNKRFDIYTMDTHSMCDTEDNLNMTEDDDELPYTYEDILRIAEKQCELRIPDIKTSEPLLLTLYTMILKHKDAIQTWMPPPENFNKFYEYLDFEELDDPYY